MNVGRVGEGMFHLYAAKIGMSIPQLRGNAKRNERERILYLQALSPRLKKGFRILMGLGMLSVLSYMGLVSRVKLCGRFGSQRGDRQDLFPFSE